MIKIIAFIFLLCVNVSAYTVCNPLNVPKSRGILDISTITTSGTLNATITTTATHSRVNIYENASSCTVAYIATSNIEDGTFVTISTATTGKTVVLNENGNMKMAGATSTLDTVWDTAQFIYDAVRQIWVNVNWKNND